MLLNFHDRTLSALTAGSLLYRYRLIHTYHSRFIPEGVAEVSQIFLQDTHVLPKLASYEEHCRRDSKPIAVLFQSISGSAINPLVAFYDNHAG
jgi:hypothetical protein